MAKLKVTAEAMMQAAGSCSLKKVRDLLAAGAGPKHLMTKTANAVTEACIGSGGGYDRGEAKRLEVVRELVAAGCGVEGQALYRPVDRGELLIVRFLIEHGADVNCVSNGCTPLVVAVENGRTDVVKELIRGGADVNQRSEASHGFGLKSSTSPIIKASTWNRTDIIRVLAEAGADPNVVDPGDYYGTPLLSAIAFDHEDAVQALIEVGADVNLAAGEEGYLPLALARDEKKTAIVKILEAANATINKKFEVKEELGRAAERGDLATVKKLIAKKADVNAQCSFAVGNVTPLVLAATNGHLDIAKVLLKAGADHNSRNKRGASVLFYTAEAGHADVVKHLLSAGNEVDEQVNAPYEGKITPLVAAAEKGHDETVKVLLAAGADVRYRSRTGKTALTAAASEGHTKVLKTLIDAVVSAKKPGRSFDTPLWYTVVFGQEKAAEILLAAGASPYATSLYEGKSISALDLARKLRKSRIHQMLKAATAAIPTSSPKRKSKAT